MHVGRGAVGMAVFRQRHLGQRTRHGEATRRRRTHAHVQHLKRSVPVGHDHLGCAVAVEVRHARSRTFDVSIPRRFAALHRMVPRRTHLQRSFLRQGEVDADHRHQEHAHVALVHGACANTAMHVPHAPLGPVSGSGEGTLLPLGVQPCAGRHGWSKPSKEEKMDMTTGTRPLVLQTETSTVSAIVRKSCNGTRNLLTSSNQPVPSKGVDKSVHA
mmetsp:Transcript_1580/g.9749  ORF Transcript_1580/g.9749 Transcript_1580/m.9749 type:complete len:215 (-) Transcript_1580:1036-1680(-)